MTRKRFPLWVLVVALILLPACGNNSPGYQLSLSKYAHPTPVQLPPVRFPKDEAPHNDLTEWWYYTGHLRAGEKSYGFELVTFQVSRQGQPLIYLAHFAITDQNRHIFQYDQHSASGRPSQPREGFNLSIGNWSMHGLGGKDHLQASMKNYAIQLNLTATKPPVLENRNGLLRSQLTGFSYYYSRTRMAVRGILTDHGRKLEVTGKAWMDHQWGNFLSLLGTGWDWFSIQLNDGTDLMLNTLRGERRGGYSYGTYVLRNGNARYISGNEYHERATGKWTSPRSGITYPFGWQIEIPDRGISLTVTPVLKNQELITTSTTGVSYWEGAVRVTGTSVDKPISGVGYVELTGYGKASAR